MDIKSSCDDGAVETLYGDYQGLRADVEELSPSGLSALNAVYSKSLLIAAASNLEASVKSRLGDAVLRRGGAELGELVRIAILARSYHTLFDWPTGHATKFFASFGKDVKSHFSELKTDEDFDARQRAFIELGHERNMLVHNDFATYSLEKTPDEIIALYRRALVFVAEIETIIFRPSAIAPSNDA